MLMTEEEAKERICPNSMASSHEQFEKCAASRCMAWRWESAVANAPGYNTTRERGFCGLAGQPCAA